ncbi:Chromosomal replication initiator protein DnaA [Dirofilaria immitis]
MVSCDTNSFLNLKLSNQTDETNNDEDSAMNEISYGPGVVQKLCARFLQLSKESNAVSLIRSPCFKRRKSLAEKNFTVISEIRRCNTQTLTTSDLTNNILLNTTEKNMNFCDGQKNELQLVSAMQVTDTAKLNGTYLYHATVIPANTKANRKAKKIESIREKFEKISITSSVLPYKKFNKVHFRRECNLSNVNSEFVSKAPELVEVQEQIQKAQHDNNENSEIERNKEDTQLSVSTDTVNVLVKLDPSNDDNLIVTKPFTVSCISSLSNLNDFQKQKMKNETRRAEKEIIDESSVNGITESSFQCQPHSITTNNISIVFNTSDKIPERKQNEDNSLQEVHRLLKKFNTIREQRAKKHIHEDISVKMDDNRYDMIDHDLLMQLQCQYVCQVSIPHSHLSSNSGLHPLYKAKKESLKNINLNKEMNSLEVMESDFQPISQNYHPGG